MCCVCVQAKKKGEVKGKTERSQEDKRRERKQKKAAKREKMREKEKHLKEVEKLNPGLGNKYSKERALKELEKQAKGNLEVIKVSTARSRSGPLNLRIIKVSIDCARNALHTETYLHM